MSKKITRKDRNTMFLLELAAVDLDNIIDELGELNSVLKSEVVENMICSITVKRDNYIELFDKYVESEGKGEFFVEKINENR